jgi:hypothetical protein
MVPIQGACAGTLRFMRVRDVLQAASGRIQRPMTWGAILLFGLLWNLMPWGLGMEIDGPGEILLPFLWGFVFLVLSPIPWQWTGDHRIAVSNTRGILLAILWNAAWTLGLLLLAGFSHPSHMGTHGHRGPGPRPERSGPERPGMDGPHHLDPLPLPPRLLILGVANLSFGMLLGWVLAGKERAEAGESAAIRAAGEARARALQSQMNPHVLFNAISGLTELVREDPQATERALVSLSGLLRNLLEYSASRSVPLSSERNLVEQYLALEQIRLGKRLRVEWRWNTELEHREVPPLLVQPLVENALKHGIAPHRGGGELCIVLREIGNGLLELEVSNTGEALPEIWKEGIGLKNLRERLDLFLPQAALRLFREGDWTRARLEMPS